MARGKKGPPPEEPAAAPKRKPGRPPKKQASEAEIPAGVGPEPSVVVGKEAPETPTPGPGIGPRNVKTQVEKSLGDHDIAERSHRIIAIRKEVARLEGEFDQVKTAHKAAVGKLETEMVKLFGEIDARKGLIEVDAVEFDLWEKRQVRVVIGDQEIFRHMTTEEIQARQTEIPGIPKAQPKPAEPEKPVAETVAAFFGDRSLVAEPSDDVETAWQKGAEAKALGKPRDANPFEEETNLWRRWNLAWLDAKIGGATIAEETTTTATVAPADPGQDVESAKCALCGEPWPHEHTAEQIAAWKADGGAEGDFKQEYGQAIEQANETLEKTIIGEPGNLDLSGISKEDLAPFERGRFDYRSDLDPIKTPFPIGSDATALWSAGYDFEERISDAEGEGAAAFGDGKGIQDNPHNPSDTTRPATDVPSPAELWQAWRNGFENAAAEEDVDDEDAVDDEDSVGSDEE